MTALSSEQSVILITGSALLENIKKILLTNSEKENFNNSILFPMNFFFLFFVHKLDSHYLKILKQYNENFSNAYMFNKFKIIPGNVTSNSPHNTP
ncbi:UNVERIFIED_CONTAM: hypothetical protein NCL1_21602 [Trichonephila clavipes]